MVQGLGFRVHKHAHWGLKSSREVVLGFFELDGFAEDLKLLS